MIGRECPETDAVQAKGLFSTFSPASTGREERDEVVLNGNTYEQSGIGKGIS